MISNRTGKDPVTSSSQAATSLRSPAHLKPSPSASTATRARDTVARLLSRRNAWNTAVGSVVAIAATLGVAAAHHYLAPVAPLAAPPTALTHVPTAAQALASANHRPNRFLEALHLNRIGQELSGLHPIRTIQRPLAALGNPLRGIATWYGSVLHGHKTASGETFDETELTAAHKTLPLGTVVRVTDLQSRRSVIVRINDRGTLAPGRIIDLSSAAAEQLGILRAGIANVKLEVLHKPNQG